MPHRAVRQTNVVPFGPQGSRGRFLVTVGSPDAADRPLILGHRGASADAPENTIDAFALARAQGADGVELDVRRCADGELVLLHDPILADGRVVADTPKAELSPATPTLAEALEECAGLLVNVEIKNSAHEPGYEPDLRIADDVVSLLRARGGRDRVLVSSFDLPTVDRIRVAAPEVPTAMLTYLELGILDVVALARERGHRAIHPWEVMVDESVVVAAHDSGLQVNVWTVDEPERIRALAAAGVDGIVTNVPARARGALGAAPT